MSTTYTKSSNGVFTIPLEKPTNKTNISFLDAKENEIVNIVVSNNAKSLNNIDGYKVEERVYLTREYSGNSMYFIGHHLLFVDDKILEKVTKPESSYWVSKWGLCFSETPFTNLLMKKGNKVAINTKHVKMTFVIENHKTRSSILSMQDEYRLSGELKVRLKSSSFDVTMIQGERKIPIAKNISMEKRISKIII